MTTYDFVHLVLHAFGGKMNGNTKLQKTVYFVGALTGELKGLSYRAHYYGPYSSDVSAAVEELRGLRFLKQHVTVGHGRDSKGFEVARYDYELTPDGKLVAEEKLKKYQQEWQQIRQAVEKLKRARAEDYVKLSIAAKSFFMRGENKGSDSPEERSRQSAQFGWAVSAEQFREADQLLKSIDLLDVDSSP